MKNWQEYVKEQNFDLNNEYKIFYIESSSKEETDNNSTLLSKLELKRVKLFDEDYKYSEEQVGDIVESMLNQFKSVELESGEVLPFLIKNEQNKVALNTRRGRANKQYGNIHYYLGKTIYDSPIFVSKNSDDKYAVVKHPKFENFGFKVI